MTTTSIAQLTDQELLAATTHAVANERRTTAELLALLAELDMRKLYLGAGYSSLFTYCTQMLYLSEPAAYSRITAARVARRFPLLLTQIADGDITLTTVSLLASHLTDENHEGLLDAARHKSKREVERLIASLQPQPEIPSSVRRLTGPVPPEVLLAPHVEMPPEPAPAQSTGETPRLVPSRPSRPVVAPIAPERYLMRVTISGDTYRKLERARDLLRHVIPNGDPAAIVDRALTLLVERLDKRRTGRTTRPRVRPQFAAASQRSRRLPASLRRAVWSRDGGRCAFVGAQGRCQEMGFLEFHHVRPFAAGGETTVENLELRCRAHNQHEAELYFGGELSGSPS